MTVAGVAGIEPYCGPETEERAGAARAATFDPAGNRKRASAGA